MQIKKFKPIDHKIKAVIYGAAGVGKTTFAATAPKPVFASAEGGLLSIADKNPDYTDIKSLKDLVDLLHYLKTEKHDYETVIIDSITEINDIIKNEIEKRSGRSMQLQDWGELSKKIKNILRSFRDLPMHVIFIAQEHNDMDESRINKIVPSLNGKAATEIAYFMDIVSYISLEADGTRKITTSPSKLLLTKDRSRLIPDSLDTDITDWIDNIAKIEAGDQEVVTEHSAPTEETVKQPTVSKKASDKETKELCDTWTDLWNILMNKDSEKYKSSNSEPTRKATIEKIVKRSCPISALTSSEVEEVIKLLKQRIDNEIPDVKLTEEDVAEVLDKPKTKKATKKKSTTTKK